MNSKSSTGYVSELRMRGYTALPAPRHVELEPDDILLDPMLCLSLSGVDEDDIAVQTLLRARQIDAEVFDFREGEDVGCQVELAIEPGAVDTGIDDGRDEQAYRIEIDDGGIRLTGNGRPGLFYAVQTFLQLTASANGFLPKGRIVDWPRFELRLVHWDTKHHRDRIDTLKRYLDWCARFKINGILFELEDKFEYPSHPVIGAPDAFTTAELQEITDYALERHIQIVPDVQGPAHLCYVLKHDEFAHLRCDGSNYQICMDEPEARQLLFDMYTDVCNATRGCKYFHVSTDEVYYAGICEKFRKPYNPENRSLTVIDYVNAAHEHLGALGRQVLIWLEYPMLPEHVELLPADLLNGIGFRKPVQVRNENEHGIRQFAYHPIQGSELTFPNYFGWTDADGVRQPGRLDGAFDATRETRVEGGNPIGTICAAWDDAGLHNETFWLGWATMAQCGWTQDAITPEETAAAFTDLYYGPDVFDMIEIYQTLQAQARFMENALEKLPSTVRGPSYGHPYWKGKMERYDRTMVPPAPPQMPNDTGVSVVPRFSDRYEAVLAEVPGRLRENDRLLARLQANVPRARRNRYNLEVFLSLACHVRQFLEMVLSIARAEELMHEAALAGKSGDDRRAMARMVAARETMQGAVDDLYAMYERLKATWQKSRLPKGAPRDGREFVHVMDDVKDHFADRRPDLSHLIAPHESLDLPGWIERLDSVIDRYGRATGLAAKKETKVPVDEG
ncbi:MAG: glycoside hydrolase family 20 zincin-like fold domain-containing protein [Planctomycetota bacterium]